MTFLLNDELKEFSGILTDFFANRCAAATYAAKVLEESAQKSIYCLPEQNKLWAELAELGVLAAAVPEEYGGLGFGVRAAQIIIEAAAGELAALPLFETITFGIVPLVYVAAESQRKSLLPEIASGQLRVTGGFEDFLRRAARSRRGGTLSMTEVPAGDTDPGGTFASGRVPFVPSYHWTGTVVVPVRCGDQWRLLLISDRGQPKDALRHSSIETFDLLRHYVELELRNARAVRLCAQSDPAAWNRLFDVQQLLLASELAAVGRRAVALTVDYVKTRKQFGRPVGSFQAVQHKLADMHLLVEETAALCRFAAWAADQDPAQLPDSAAAAGALARERMPAVVEQAIQAHGGIGFTYEYILHLYLRRARTLAALCGSSGGLYLQLGHSD